MATAVNEHTGAIMRSSSSNYEQFAKNYDAMKSGDITVSHVETLFPILIKVPSQLHKELGVLAAVSGDTLEGVANKIFMAAVAC